MTNTRKRLKVKRKASGTQTPEEKHVAAIQAELDKVRNMTPVGLNRIVASFPELRDLINNLGDLVEAADPTAGRHLDPDQPYISRDSSGDGIVAFGDIATHRAGISTYRFRKEQDRVRKRLGNLAYTVSVALGGGDGIHYEKPRCKRTNCPEHGIRQPMGTTECLGCGRAFE